MKTITLSVREASITEHPSFHEKRNDWGVIPAHYSTEIYDDGDEVEVWNDEDRSGHRPELDGMSMSDMWDFEKNDWRIQPPGAEGIRSFLIPVVEEAAAGAAAVPGLTPTSPALCEANSGCPPAPMGENGGMSDLLPCPFCGFEDPEIGQNQNWCPNCGARGPTDLDAWGLESEPGRPRSIQQAWNRRALCGSGVAKSVTH